MGGGVKRRSGEGVGASKSVAANVHRAAGAADARSLEAGFLMIVTDGQVVAGRGGPRRAAVGVGERAKPAVASVNEAPIKHAHQADDANSCVEL